MLEPYISEQWWPLFHDMIYKDIKVYIDDMIAKIRMEKSHVQTLRKLFERLRKYELK
jgi:hypothetical protein